MTTWIVPGILRLNGGVSQLNCHPLIHLTSGSDGSPIANGGRCNGYVDCNRCWLLVFEMENSWREIAKAPRSKRSTSGTMTTRMPRIGKNLRMATPKSVTPVQSARKRVRRETLTIRRSARQEVRARINRTFRHFASTSVRGALPASRMNGLLARAKCGISCFPIS